MTSTHTPAQYVVTYANHDGETIQRGPVSASDALAIADNVTPYLPGWAGPVRFYLEGDYDGEITVTREWLESDAEYEAARVISGPALMREVLATRTPAIGSPAICLHMCDMCTEMIPSRFDFCEACAYEVGFRTYPVSTN